MRGWLGSDRERRKVMRNKKTSTAALDSVQKWPAPIRGAFLAILAAQEGCAETFHTETGGAGSFSKRL
jgi:hypothetical protein